MLTVIHNIYRTATKQIEDNQALVGSIFHKIGVSRKKIENYSIVHLVMGYSKSQSIPRRLKIAIEYLQHENNENKLNVVYELGQLAQDCPQHHWLIMEVLSHYVRNHANESSQASVNGCSISSIRAEIQAALTVLAERDTEQDPENQQLDLSHTNLRGANLKKANLEQANLYRVNFSGANLSGANLCGTILSAANLCQANLAGANLSESILSAANLAGANLTGANFYYANLYLANLHEVILNETIFNEANLREAKFTVTDTANGKLLRF